ncbi:unnamed protein product [marine sediment metagenome]|uniref:Uncharacterized protein n=1 Tax=marine sediment metagenome TaxID=412755 RepID=X0UZC1_9ZZZZ
MKTKTTLAALLVAAVIVTPSYGAEWVEITYADVLAASREKRVPEASAPVLNLQQLCRFVFMRSECPARTLHERWVLAQSMQNFIEGNQLFGLVTKRVIFQFAFWMFVF